MNAKSVVGLLVFCILCLSICFFSKYAHSERTMSLVLPLIPALREAGAYIEYRLKDGLPEFDHSRFYSHQEIFDPEYARLYLFDHEEYPEIRHHERVCYEQAMVSLLDVYQFINGPPADRARIPGVGR